MTVSLLIALLTLLVTLKKTYQVVVGGIVSVEALKELASGIHLKEAKTKPAKARLVKCQEHQSIIEITITEGKNRQLRRMCAQLGLPGTAISQNRCQ